jgi:uncharacterized membrane protein
VPRFLRDRGNQVVLGIFIATFMYCLIVLRTVRSAADGTAAAADRAAFVPHLAILGGMILALLSVAVLIYFLHHVPTRISAGSVIGLLGNELLFRLERMFPRCDEVGDDPPWPVDEHDGEEIRLTEPGPYLRIVDYEGLLAFAEREDRRITTLVAPGDFCVKGTPIMRIHGGPLDDACVREVRAFFSLGGDRTPDQDILFSVEQLAEIAGKALSTGVNDQFTALLCIDQMERVLCAAGERRTPHAVRNLRGIARLFVTHVSLPQVADGFLVPLRQFARGDLITTDRLIAMLDSCISRQAWASPLADNLRRHRDATLEEANASLPTEAGRTWLAERVAKRRTALSSDPTSASES